MKTKYLIIITAILVQSSVFAQKEKGLSYGASGGLQINSAILPDIEENRDLISVLQGEDVVKGTPQLSDFKLNFKIGGFAKYEDGFGFTKVELNYTPTKIYKEFKINTGTDLVPNYTYATLDVSYSYLDIAFSYNVYLYKNVFFSLGGSPSFLLSDSGTISAESSDFRVFTGFGYKLENNMSISARAEVGIKEVYNDSYIHHIMIPITVSIPF